MNDIIQLIPDKGVSSRYVMSWGTFNLKANTSFQENRILITASAEMLTSHFLNWLKFLKSNLFRTLHPFFVANLFATLHCKPDLIKSRIRIEI